MIQRTKRSWHEADTERFVAAVMEAKGEVVQMLARAPIGSPEYRALSAFLAAIHEAAIFLGCDWVGPTPAKQDRKQ
ncbi:hypothetical protein V5F49_13005 [Xanthobacter sp. V3C-3]|uniref:hypothetical protein n=1 Tax=Xanthobacter lutulentifluminis TaxID=3119935 RepID=UPI00372BB192